MAGDEGPVDTRVEEGPEVGTLRVSTLGSIRLVETYDRRLTIGGLLMMDMRDNEVIDLEFSYHWTEEDGHQVYNLIVIPRGHTRFPEYAAPVASGTTIGGKGSGSPVRWTDMAQAMLYRQVVAGEPQAWQGEWLGQKRGLLPISLELQEGGTVYGWLELSIEMPSGGLILHRFAYNEVADEPIQAGLTEAAPTGS